MASEYVSQETLRSLLDRKQVGEVVVVNRGVLNQALAKHDLGVKAVAWDEGVARAETRGVEAAFDDNPYRREQA